MVKVMVVNLMVVKVDDGKGDVVMVVKVIAVKGMVVKVIVVKGMVVKVIVSIS